MHDLGWSYIPLIRNKGDASAAQNAMPNVDVVRVPLDLLDGMELEEHWRLWIDTQFDGFDHIFDDEEERWLESTKGWHGWVQGFEGFELLTTEKNAKSASQDKIDDLVAAVLDEAAEYEPTMISVPQVAYTTGAIRHAINRKLAIAAGRWKQNYWPRGTFVLPVVFTHVDAYRTKSIADKRINAILRALDASHATGVWVSHARLDELGGVGNLKGGRLSPLIAFHENLNDQLPAKAFTCAGPYWALNLILWARGLIDFPIIGSGSQFQYSTPKPVQLLGRPKPRIALPLLRRWYPVNSELRGWIKSAKSSFAQGTDAWDELKRLESTFGTFLGSRGAVPARRQTLEFYIDWIDQIESTQKAGRALFLFQDFSNAVVNGSLIRTKLPKQSGLSADARNPGFIAEQYMLQCLPR